jgi:hypothetical protein
LAARASSKTYASGATCEPEKCGIAAVWLSALMHRSTPMFDVLMLALAFGFFAAAIGYTYACERL